MKFYELNLKKIGNSIFDPGIVEDYLQEDNLYDKLLPMFLKWHNRFENASYPGLQNFNRWFKEINKDEEQSLNIYIDFKNYSFFHKKKTKSELNLFKIKGAILSLLNNKSCITFTGDKDTVLIINSVTKWWAKYYSQPNINGRFDKWFKKVSQSKEFLDDFDLDYFKKFI